MERNRLGTIFAGGVLALICTVGVVSSFASSPEHPIKASLLTLGVIFGGLLAISGLHFLLFVPLFMST